MPDYRTLDAISVDYLMERPEEIREFLEEIVADYARDGDAITLASALKVVIRVLETTDSQQPS